MENNQNLFWGDTNKDNPPNTSWESTNEDTSPNVTWESANEDNPLNLNWNPPANPPENQINNNSFSTQENTELPKSPTIITNEHDNEGLFSYLGSAKRIEVNSDLFYFNIDNSRILQDVNDLDLKPLDDDCRFDFSPKSETALGDVIRGIVKIAIKQGLKIKDCFLYKVPPNQSVLNVYRGKPSKSFVYFIQANNKSGKIILDLSSIGGPSITSQDPIQNILNIVPGWVPYSVSKNNSDKELIFIAGTLDQ